MSGMSLSSVFGTSDSGSGSSGDGGTLHIHTHKYIKRPVKNERNEYSEKNTVHMLLISATQTL